ncbi:hypothetical protein [Halogranum rubrum]|uniref:Uncharacterized protein n=1 Tax=Halogranum salarium B-1 TaxID=1210908 RepID=J3JHF8_9EURY|nr:hypothetical protein [Halogranum salarium]EJN60959.1 hypothetical protein HSB1_15620 [Halogranum salarium B-1]
MNRRAFLTTAAATLSVGASAGCLADGGNTGGSDSTENESTESDEPTTSPTATPTATPSAPSVASTTLEAMGDCSDSGTASVAFESPDVVVTGCIQGPNGCHQPVLQDATVEDGALRVVVTTEAEGDGACTQALVQRKYEATISFDDSLPSTVEVVHDSMGEQTTVTTADQ